METLKDLLPFALRASLWLLAFAIGLDSSVSDATYVLRRPKLLLRSIASINVAVPAFAVFIAAVFPLPQLAKIAIVLMAVSPLPVIAPSTELKLGGHKPYVYGLLVAVSVLSIIIVPLTVALISAAFPGQWSISPLKIAESILLSVLAPLGIGMILYRLAPQASMRTATVISKIAMIVLIIGIVPLLAAVWPAMQRQIGNGTVLAIIAVVVAGLAAGHFLGGPSSEDRTSLAIASATRHPGIAIMIANENVADPRIKAAILLFLFVSAVVMIPYQIWVKRHQHPTDTIHERRT